ncbi:hypothetical protein PoB_002467400 [Plakobranchus ocellatus]|uniref:Uncharacterized protein n=1 Tax=Plakobranchus ocellatus TaxID=259542 RepID=A0AAV3ZW73_9GAST|nr:hypothetical protein PoB_002467400 [Plakobranchus ocellatus]
MEGKAQGWIPKLEYRALGQIGEIERLRGIGSLPERCIMTSWKIGGKKISESDVSREPSDVGSSPVTGALA